jgi:hypothetical protein
VSLDPALKGGECATRLFNDTPRAHVNPYDGPKDGKTYHFGVAARQGAGRRYLVASKPDGAMKDALFALMRK